MIDPWHIYATVTQVLLSNTVDRVFALFVPTHFTSKLHLQPEEVELSHLRSCAEIIFLSWGWRHANDDYERRRDV